MNIIFAEVRMKLASILKLNILGIKSAFRIAIIMRTNHNLCISLWTTCLLRWIRRVSGSRHMDKHFEAVLSSWHFWQNHLSGNFSLQQNIYAYQYIAEKECVSWYVNTIGQIDKISLISYWDLILSSVWSNLDFRQLFFFFFWGGGGGDSLSNPYSPVALRF